VNVSELATEETHNLWLDVEGGEGKVNLLVTISGTSRGDSPSNLSNWERDLDLKQAEWIQQYVRKNWAQNEFNSSSRLSNEPSSVSRTLAS